MIDFVFLEARFYMLYDKKSEAEEQNEKRIYIF